jgi:hypothetical protein
MKQVNTSNSMTVAEVVFECEAHWDGSYSLSAVDIEQVENLGLRFDRIEGENEGYVSPVAIFVVRS